MNTLFKATTSGFIPKSIDNLSVNIHDLCLPYFHYSKIQIVVIHTEDSVLKEVIPEMLSGCVEQTNLERKREKLVVIDTLNYFVHYW